MRTILILLVCLFVVGSKCLARGLQSKNDSIAQSKVTELPEVQALYDAGWSKDKKEGVAHLNNIFIVIRDKPGKHHRYYDIQVKTWATPASSGKELLTFRVKPRSWTVKYYDTSGKLLTMDAWRKSRKA